MRGLVNDYLRNVIGWAIKCFGSVSSGWFRLRMLRFEHDQKRLQQEYAITRDTPVLPYGPETVELIKTAARRHGDKARFALTSGSTGQSKEMLFTSRRLRSIKFTFSDMFARACYACGVKRTSLFVFSSFQTDESLTTLVLDENDLPDYLSTLQAPYRVQRHPAIQALVNQYGATAVRLWLLTLANPGVLYSTNPSTISTFLDEVVNDWRGSSELIRDWYQHAASFSSGVQRVAHRLVSRGVAARLNQITLSSNSLPLSVCAPAVEAYICWTGGYVKPFLDRLATHLPPPRYKLIPMYSMSTETIATLAYFRRDEVGFLPMAAGVAYEFVAETALDQADNLLKPHELEPGKLYAMVVSDAYGLQRYQTNDLFLCKRKIRGLPDLAFVRRRTLEYSFTGEKLTAEQLSTVFAQLRTLYPAVVADGFLTCVPSQPDNGIPHYKILLISDGRTHTSHHLLAARCDELLAEINSEYRSKRASGRLGPVAFLATTVKEFAARLADNGNWESQFKFLPLCRRTWERI